MQEVGYSPEDVHAEYLNRTLKPHRDVSECLKPYDIEYNTKKGTLLLVVPAGYNNGSSIVGAFDKDSEFLFRLREHRYDRAYEYEYGYAYGYGYGYGGNLNNLTYPGWSLRVPGNSTWQHFENFIVEHKSGAKRGYYYDVFIDSDYLSDVSVDSSHLSDVLIDLDDLYTEIICTNPGESQLRDFLKNSMNTWVKHVDLQSNGPGKRNTLGRELDEEFMQPDQLTINQCYSKDLEEKCQFYFSLPISLTVIGCNIAKVICMYLTARCNRKSVLLTLGDGLSSFLHKPDVTTKGRCFLSKLDMTREKIPWCRESPNFDTLDTTPPDEMGNPQPIQLRRHPQHLPRRSWWFRSPGWMPWTLTLSL